MDEVTVLELFSGIGGMHSAMDIVNQYLPVKLKVIGAIDINTVANEVYRHNFPQSPCLQKNITGLTPEYLRYVNCALLQTDVFVKEEKLYTCFYIIDFECLYLENLAQKWWQCLHHVNLTQDKENS